MNGNINITHQATQELRLKGLTDVSVETSGAHIVATGTAPNGKPVRVSGRDIFSLGKSAEEAIEDAKQLIKS